MARLTLPALVVVVGIVLVADLLVVNPTLGDVAGIVLEAVILVAAGAALGGVAALAVVRGNDLLHRRQLVPAAMVLLGMGAMLLAGLRPGSAGSTDPATRWLVTALLVPLAAALFGLLFVSTLGAMRRALVARPREAGVMVAAAMVVLVLALPLGGTPGTWLAASSGWVLAVPLGGVFRGILIGVAIVTAVAAARTMLGIGQSDD